MATVLGVVKGAGESQPGGSGCGPASEAATYDGNGNVASRTDFNGNLSTYTYDLSRNLETQRVEASGRPESRTVSTQWHGYWRLPIKVAEPKKLTTYVYNGDGGVYCAPTTATVPSVAGGTQPIGVLCSRTEQATTDATGSAGLGATVTGTPRTWTWTYNQYGQVLTANGPRTDVTDLTTTTYYDATDPDLGKRGNVATIANALGHLTRITAYDLNGNPLTVIDPNGVTTTLTYDLRQRLTSRNVGGETTTYTYDAAGQLTRVTLPDGSYLAYTYDGAHRLTQVADILGNTVTYTLDAIGNRTREDVKDPGGNLAKTRSRIFDALSRLAQDIGAQSQATLYEYDANGNRTKVTDPLSHATVSSYDALNRLIQVTDPGTGITRYAYDGQDRLAQVTDPRNLVTSYTVDGLGNATRLSSPDTGISNKSFDPAGNEITRTDAKGQVTATTYDALNRPTLVTFQDGSTIAYVWDLGSNGIGRLGRIEDYGPGGSSLGSIQYAYDALGRVTGETRTVGSVSHNIGYAYGNGQLAALTTPNGKTLSYIRNAAGQVSQITLTSNGNTKTLASNIAYQPFGGIKSYTDGAGQIHTRVQDQDGRLSGYNLGAQSWLVSYDTAGRITGQVDAGNATNSGIYGYDALDRLTGATLPASTYGYTYDATGNRSSQTVGAVTRSYTTDTASNRLQGITNPPQSYAHDANGSVTGDGSGTFAYDARGRLAQVTVAGTTTAYQINALGQRVKKTTGGTVTLYHYDTAGHLLAESDGTGNLQREYVWLDDTPLAVLQ
jgi:YD repeat-containing protein